MKYLFWLVLIFVALFFYRKAAANAQRARMQERHPNAGHQTGNQTQGASERGRRFGRTGRKAHQESLKTITMVQCEHCHTHVPEDEALIRYGHVWCNEEHERLGPRT